MPDTELLTDEAIEKIDRRLMNITGIEMANGKHPVSWDEARALIATVKQLRTRIQLLESQWCECGHLKTVHGFFSDHDECYECDQASPDLCCEWRPVARPNTELEQLRAENEWQKLIVDIGTNDDPGTAILKVCQIEKSGADAFRSRAVDLCNQKAAEWLAASRAETNDAKSNELYAECCAARKLAAEMEKLT